MFKKLRRAGQSYEYTLQWSATDPLRVTGWHRGRVWVCWPSYVETLVPNGVRLRRRRTPGGEHMRPAPRLLGGV